MAVLSACRGAHRYGSRSSCCRHHLSNPDGPPSNPAALFIQLHPLRIARMVAVGARTGQPIIRLIFWPFRTTWEEEPDECERPLSRRNQRVRRGRGTALLPRSARLGGRLRRRQLWAGRRAAIGLPSGRFRVVFLSISASDTVLELFDSLDVERHSRYARPTDYGQGHICSHSDDDAASLHTRRRTRFHRSWR